MNLVADAAALSRVAGRGGAAVEIERVSKEFAIGRERRVAALSEFSLTLGGGDFVAVVGPRGLVRRRLYSAGAIAFAFALYGVAELAPAEVRSRGSPLRIVGPTAAAGWASLCRWAGAVRARRLFPAVRALPAVATARQMAARAATTLAAYAPAAGGLAIESAAFLGASM